MGLCENGFEHGARLDPGQCGPNAVVNPVSERQVMARRTAFEVDRVRVFVLRRIPVARGKEQQRSGPARDVNPAECGVMRDAAHHLPKRRFQP